jgi:esterase
MKLFFRRFGNGKPVIILHGLFGISDNWVSIGKRLAENFTVYIPDLRNHGQSPHSMLFNFPALVEDLLEFTEDNKLENIILIGHSLGGIISMHFALQHSFIIRKIVVVDISLRKYQNYDDHRHIIDAMMGVDFSNVHKRSDIDKQLLNTIPSPKLRHFILKNVYWRDKDILDWRLNLTALNENLPLIFENTTEENKFSGPALFIRGGLSDYVRDEDLKEIYKKFPRAELLTIPNASHWVHADAPEEFLEIVLQFILSHED